MKRLLTAASLFSLLQAAALAGPLTHLRDMELDSQYWRQGHPQNGECPGPHFLSIFENKWGNGTVMRTCVDTSTVIRRPDGDARARFLRVTTSVAPKHYVRYSSEWRAVNCKTRHAGLDVGYRVTDFPGDQNPTNWLSLGGRPEWFVYAHDGDRKKIPKRLQLQADSKLEYISRMDRFLCPEFWALPNELD